MPREVWEVWVTWGGAQLSVTPGRESVARTGMATAKARDLNS